MKKITTIITILLIAIACNAQTAPNSELARLLKRDYGFRLPYNMDDGRVIDATSSPLPSSIYDAKVYYDNQCKRYELTSSNDELFSTVDATYRIPNTNYFICDIGTDIGATGNGTSVLLIVDVDGRIWDELVCRVNGEYYIIKQFSISSNYEITIYSIEPADSKSILLSDYNTSFKGYRQDCVYKVQNGKFVRKSIKKGKTRTISPSNFKKGQWDLWEPYWQIK